MNILESNKEWAKKQRAANSTFFSEMAKGQEPQVFWIGCCDSRVIPTEICDLGLGDVFVHTNIAGQVQPEDDTMLSALEYATAVLKVKEIVVCGHSGCGGIRAAMSSDRHSPALEKWLAPLRELYKNNKQDERLFAIASIKQQVNNLQNTACIKELSSKPKIYGVFYDLETGELSAV